VCFGVGFACAFPAEKQIPETASLIAVAPALFSDVGPGGAPGGGGGIASRLVGSVIKRAENPDKTFADVVGVDEAKGDLQEIVMYLKDPKKFTRLGGKLPKGVSERWWLGCSCFLLFCSADGMPVRNPCASEVCS
jgi:hypothetical protein